MLSTFTSAAYIQVLFWLDFFYGSKQYGPRSDCSKNNMDPDQTAPKNNMDPDQTAPKNNMDQNQTAPWEQSDLGPYCLQKWI